MNIFAKVSVGLGAVVVVACAILVWDWILPRQSSEVFDTVAPSNGKFSVRAKAYKETGYMPGAYYVFESLPAGASAWIEIVTVRYDDRVPIPRDQIRFVNENIAYLFMGWTYAVTVNAGTTWSKIEDVTNFFRDNDHVAFRYLDKVAVSDRGVGKMELKPIDEDSGRTRYLSTEDYGQHWRRNPQ